MERDRRGCARSNALPERVEMARGQHAVESAVDTEVSQRGDAEEAPQTRRVASNETGMSAGA